MLGPAMTLAELIEGLRILNAPNQGMSYHSGGYRRGSPQFNEYTGERLMPRYDAAELNIYSDRAKFLYRLIENGEQLAAALQSLLPLGGEDQKQDQGSASQKPDPIEPRQTAIDRGAE